MSLLLQLTGSPLERGRAHGQGFATEINDVISRWRAEIATEFDPDELIGHTVGECGLLDAARQYTPDLVEEVTGLAEGCGQSFETMFAWQLVDELWWNLDELTESARAAERCSALAINSDGRGVVAQTQDLNRYLDTSQTILHYIDDDGLEILAPSCAGLLGLNGVNSAGLAVGITTLSPLAHGPGGVASGLLTMRLLRCRGVDEALAVLGSVPIASGNSFILGTRERSVIVEVSSSGFVISDDGDRAIRTNHPVAMTPAYDHVRFAYSTERYEQLDQTVRAESSLEDLATMYRSGAICQSRSKPGDVVTIGTMLFELGERPRCHYAPGPLDDETLTTYDFTEGAFP